VQVWISYAQFVASTGDVAGARDIFQRSLTALKLAPELKEEARVSSLPSLLFPSSLR
jgi:hypothetical protein